MSRFSLDQISAFLCVVRQGGIGKAAQAMNLTQPAMTARIRNLEEALGKTLFERTAAGLRLTKDGELMLSYAERFEHLVDLVDRHLTDPRGVEGYLRIGASETITQCWLPDFVTRMHRLFPKMTVELNVDISVNLRAALLDREIDLAFLLGPVSEYTVNNVELPGFELAWYAAATGDADAAALLRLPVLTYARNTRPYRELKAMLFERLGPSVLLFPSSSLSACFRLVGAGIGVAALPKSLAEPYVAAGRIREFDPGWVPDPLRFTASYLAAPKSHVVETAAGIAHEIACAFHAHKDC